MARQPALVMMRERGGHLTSALAGPAIEPELYRNRAPADALADHLTGHQRDLWSYLEALAAGTQRLAVPEELTREGEHAFALTRAESRRVATERRLRDLEAKVVRESRRADEHWLSEIQASASWRFTAPLRAILQALRRLRGRLLPSR